MVGNWLDKLDQSERKHNPRSLGLIFGKRHYGQNEASIVIRSSEPCFSRAHNSQIYLLSIASFAIVVKSLSHNGLHSISPCFATSRGHRSVRLTVRSSFLRCSPLLLSNWTRRIFASVLLDTSVPVVIHHLFCYPDLRQILAGSTPCARVTVHVLRHQKAPSSLHSCKSHKVPRVHLAQSTAEYTSHA